MKLLTKSKYLAGLQCPKYLWVQYHDRDRIPEPGAMAKHLFKEGDKVGEMAKKLYPEGIDISFDSFKENLTKSKELLKEGKPLFEPGYIHENCFSRADVLVPVGDEWDIVEVKSGTKVKDVNVHDVSFQKYVYEGAGLKIRNCYLMHLNTEYVRDGDLDVEKLFKLRDITEKVEEFSKGLEDRIEVMLDVISADKDPRQDIGAHCKSPYACPLTECWDHLEDNHVFKLYMGGAKSQSLYESGVHAIKDIPDAFKLTDKQDIQRECEKTGKEFVSKGDLKHFLKDLNYPLYYLDFETFNTAVPMFDGLSPHQQVPFQYSLHVVKEEGSKPEHYEFLYRGSSDPRKEFLDSLKGVIGSSGDIVVYHAPFEKSILKKVGNYFGEEEWVSEVNSRIVDLLIPFRNFHYYNSKQQGSASIKKVLPALVGKDYSGLGIQEGAAANTEFMRVTYSESEDKEKVYADLLEYCELDTKAMVWIVDKLREKVV
ncbi:DUF2779 domain-containing protein [archaeon]|jgi:predicted RecB family nuclease|nr:DUF2779 domain-containing protein [archaeon]MBT6824299.1 DUF2779 domain-containing protein [archaeon]MBT7107377.1 DUF2779 domain-containing protein [archaeon]MBT7297343.1 DUF2779 domain-containing protein [archaeon]